MRYFTSGKTVVEAPVSVEKSDHKVSVDGSAIGRFEDQ